ncbi:DUF6283 family protein [Streptomyces sp. NPDC099088]|uniref:DUF6283 family protein n=1 Tax=Streptomyces sp. NPDC099088 TaxID=3366101 RepID=UPI0038161F8F
MTALRPPAPAPRPCESCPYRRDVPSGVWAAEEYDKLVRYDAETGEQPAAMFQCHQADGASQEGRACAGWASCHGEDLLAPRLALIDGRIDSATFEAISGYVSPVPVFASGAEAAAHGRTGIHEPGPDADRLIAKILRSRTDLRQS